MIEVSDQTIMQVGLALKLLVDKFAYTDFDKSDEQKKLLGYKEKQFPIINHAQVMARAQDIIVKAVLHLPLPSIGEETQVTEVKRTRTRKG